MDTNDKKTTDNKSNDKENQKNNGKGKKSILKLALIGVVTGLCNGLFGSGGGTIVVPAMEKFLGVEEHKAHATAILIILPLTIISMILYTMNGYLDFPLVWKVSLGGIAGGIIGAAILKKLSGKVIKKIFGVFMIIAAVRMVF
jgi:uncharacterized membrane protein YfcA